MANPIGESVVTSIARRYILDEIQDNVYQRAALFFRLNQGNKKIVRGGYQIEVPLMYDTFAAGGPYTGFEQLDVTPSDTVKNGAWDWRQYFVPVTVDGLTLIKTDSPEAIADFIRLYFTQAEMEMARLLNIGCYNATPGNKHIDGIPQACDDGTNVATYGGLERVTANPWWKGNYDGTAVAFNPATIRAQLGVNAKGGRNTTVIMTTQKQYDRLWAYGAGATGDASLQRYPTGPQAVDEQMMQAGFTNILADGVPVVVDDIPGVDPTADQQPAYFLNEDYWWLAVSPRADFFMEDFQTPVNQDAMTAKLFWAGNLVCNNCNTQGVLSNCTS